MCTSTDQLVNSNRKVVEIARALGYHSLHTFTRLFTKHVGMPPGHYRTRFGLRVSD